jgi:hypothetical protein
MKVQLANGHPDCHWLQAYPSAPRGMVRQDSEHHRDAHVPDCERRRCQNNEAI